MLPRPLRLLLTLQTRARLRRLARGARTVKGAIYLLFLVGMGAVSVVPSLFLGFIGGRTEPELVRSYLASGLFAYCTLTVATMGPESGVFFTPAEIDFLFPGPFTRRQLLVYRLCGFGVGCLLMALFFSAFLLKHVTYWIAGYVGVFLALAFILLVQTSVALALSLVAESAYTRARRIGLAAVLGITVVGVALAARGAGEAGVVAVVRQFHSSWIGVLLLAPFEVFARAMTARTLLPELLAWGGLAAAMDVALAAFILKLDANFLERSTRATQVLYEKLQRARSGGALANLVHARDARWRVPRLPWLAGAGPIAWRQLMTGVRSTRGLAIILMAIAAATVVPIALVPRTGSAELVGAALIVPLLAMSAFLLPQMLQFDFRGDIDRLDVIKALPLSATAISIGQLLAPVLMATLIQALMLAVLAATSVGFSTWIVGALLLSLPGNFLIFAIENLVFLLYPVRMLNVGTGDLQAVARQMLMMFLKMGVLLLAAGLAVAAGGLALWLTGSQVAAIATGGLAVCALSAALVPAIAHAFCRFDPSLDTPA